MFKVFKRTEGVSTTCITGKLLAIAEDRIKQEAKRAENNLGLEYASLSGFKIRQKSRDYLPTFTGIFESMTLKELAFLYFTF